MAKRAEGLSPNFDSIISPQIPSSLIFSWTFIPTSSTDYQKNAVIKIYEEGSDTALLTASTTDTEIDLSAQLEALPIDERYEWEVTVTAADNSTKASGRKSFQYVTLITEGDLDWPDGPVPYEYIGTRQYFSDIRENALTVLNDYVIDSAEEEKMVAIAEDLFSGDIVPTRKDFVAIENILAFIAMKESSYKSEVDDLIEDGLGADDVHKIYAFFDRLTSIPPLTPNNVYLSFDNIIPLTIIDGNVSNKGVTDLSVDINWTPDDLRVASCYINVDNELSEDINYYTFVIDAGFTDYSCSFVLHYRLEDIENMGRQIEIPMVHTNFKHLSTSKQTRYSLRASAVDKHESTSSEYYKIYNVKHVPLGVSSYQLRAKQMDLLDQKVIKNYYDIYNGTKKAYVHNVKGNVDGVYHYSVRLTDINGEISPWFFIPNDVKIDPLKPPAAPKPKVKSADTDSITFTWDYVKTADKYEIDPLFGSALNSTITTNTKTYSGLDDNKSYSVRVRATNRAGSSSWVTVKGKTKAKPPVTHVEETGKTRTWRTNYVIYLQSGNVTHMPSEYNKRYDNKQVFHGQWIELRDKKESGLYVKKGTRWGNNKSLFFLDYKEWQDRLKGKEILEVKFYIRRKSTEHGYPYDGRFLHVYSHNYPTFSSLPSAKTGPKLHDHHKVEKLDFNRGEGHWITLPKAFGEKLRDGKIKGIAFHNPDSEKTPYSYMRFDSDTFKFSVKYK